MSQYEMESSGVFSDADAGRKSAHHFEVRSGNDSDHSGLPVALPEVAEDLEIVAEHLPDDADLAAGQAVDEVVTGAHALYVEADLVDEVFDVESKENVAKETRLRKEKSVVSKPEDSPRLSRGQKPAPVTLVQRPRSQEAKGLATRRSELLQEKPILPNTNVGSKLKEILSRQPANAGKQGKSRFPGLDRRQLLKIRDSGTAFKTLHFLIDLQTATLS
jgi:hypothetical protein